MSAYKDVGKRKIYQKEWARKNAIKKIDGSLIVKSTPESTYCILFNKMRKIREEHQLSDFSYWMVDIRKMNKDFMSRYGKYMERDTEVKRVESLVELVKPEVITPITDTYFECEYCKKKVRRNGRNGMHDLCPPCFFDESTFERGKCLITLDSL
jgi:hypothetical protein